MRVLFLGDIYGRAGRKAVMEAAPKLKKDLKLDVLIVNAENAARIAGVTPQICDKLYEAGVDVITLGDHAFDRQEIFPYMDETPNIIRPINFGDEKPGRFHTIFETSRGKKLLVINAMGSVFMKEETEGFDLVDTFLKKYPLGGMVDGIFVDFHAEATSEKQAFGHFMDGRVSCVVGTHTHCPTSDTKILPKGTGYQTDAGMCGDYNSVIGAEIEEPINRFTTKEPGGRLKAAMDEVTLSGTFFELGPNGLPTTISAFVQGPHLMNIGPA